MQNGYIKQMQALKQKSLMYDLKANGSLYKATMKELEGMFKDTFKYPFLK